MRGNRCFAGAVHEIVQAVRGIEDAHRRDPDCGSTAVMVPRDPRGVGGLMKFPQGLDTRMYTLRAAEHLTTDGDVSNVPLVDDGPRDGEGPLGIVRRLADPPLVFGIPRVSGNYRPGGAFEPADAAGIPMEDLV